VVFFLPSKNSSDRSSNLAGGEHRRSPPDKATVFKTGDDLCGRSKRRSPKYFEAPWPLPALPNPAPDDDYLRSNHLLPPRRFAIRQFKTDSRFREGGPRRQRFFLDRVKSGRRFSKNAAIASPWYPQSGHVTENSLFSRLRGFQGGRRAMVFS